MARPNPVRSIMEGALPSLTYQRRKLFRPKPKDVIYAYNILNRHIFDSQLKRPEIKLQTNLPKIWGCCHWLSQKQPSGSYCFIRLSDKWFCSQWFLNTLAHEMVHQYQWDIYRWEHLDLYDRPMFENSGAHGPSFHAWRERFEYFGLNLKLSHSQRKWFKYQDLTRC